MSAESVAIVGVGVALLAVLVPLILAQAGGREPWPPASRKCAAVCAPWLSAWPGLREG